MTCKYVVLACALAATMGTANATTYNYVGPSFDSTPLSSGYIYDAALGSNITGSVTFNTDTSAFSGQIATTLGPGVGNPAVLSLGLTAGTFSLNSSAFGAGSPLAAGFTFVNGQIVAWSVCGNSTPGGCEGSNVGIAGNGLSIIQVGGSIAAPAGDIVQESATVIVNGQTMALGARVNANCFFNQPDCTPDSAFGSWTELSATDATPLPAALPLFVTGLGSMGLLGFWRKRKTAAKLPA